MKTYTYASAELVADLSMCDRIHSDELPLLRDINTFVRSVGLVMGSRLVIINKYQRQTRNSMNCIRVNGCPDMQRTLLRSCYSLRHRSNFELVRGLEPRTGGVESGFEFPHSVSTHR